MRRFAAFALGGGLATLLMDLLNALGARHDLIGPIRHELIGRLLVAWGCGDFAFDSPLQVPHVTAERELGFLFHYGIGIMFFALYWYVCCAARLQARSPMLASAFGASTSLISFLFVFPSMGLGLFGLKVPQARLLVTSLANHLFYGFGVFLGLRAVQRLQLLRSDAPEVARESATSG